MTAIALAFARAIQMLKEANDLDNPDIAGLFGVTESAVSRWLNCKSLPPPARRRRHEEHLQMPFGWLDNPTIPVPLLGRPAGARTPRERGTDAFVTPDAQIPPAPAFPARGPTITLGEAMERWKTVLDTRLGQRLRGGLADPAMLCTPEGRAALKQIWHDAADATVRLGFSAEGFYSALALIEDIEHGRPTQKPA